MKHFLTGGSLLCTLVLFTNCTKDDDGPGTTSRVQFEITDGPIDDTNVTGAFVTVSAIKVNGETISEFSGKQTIDLTAYQNGDTKLLGFGDLETGTYSNVSLVLDCGADANGNTPGCYVLTKDNVKHDLEFDAGAPTEITVSSGNFEVKENDTSEVVIDFDLRKAIRYDDDPQTGDAYDFVTNAELRNALRVISKSEAGTIEGSITDNLGLAGDKIVVYAYKKGSFNKSTEIQAQGESGVQFKNATTSATVDAQGNYTLPFLQEGEYELHFFGYYDLNFDGQMELIGELALELLGNLGLNLNDVEVGANTNVTVTVSVTGILP